MRRHRTTGIGYGGIELALTIRDGVKEVTGTACANEEAAVSTTALTSDLNAFIFLSFGTMSLFTGVNTNKVPKNIKQ